MNTMASIKVYIFNSESEATELIKKLDKIKGLPTKCMSTLTYCNFEVINDKIVIRWDEFIESIIGKKPIILEIKEQIEFSVNS